MKLIDFLRAINPQIEEILIRSDLWTGFIEYMDYEIFISGHPGEIGSSFDKDCIEVDTKSKRIYVTI